MLSDVDTKISYDVMRNQIARNIDVMLEPNPGLLGGLEKRKPEYSCLVLVTPHVFKRHPHSRLYGFLMDDYKDPAAIMRDLGHREKEKFSSLPARIGWLTFEDCEAIAPGACPWLSSSE